MYSGVVSSDLFCVHKSTYWIVVNKRVHQQFYCVSCGGINNLIWIFSLHFDICYRIQTIGLYPKPILISDKCFREVSMSKFPRDWEAHIFS